MPLGIFVATLLPVVAIIACLQTRPPIVAVLDCIILGLIVAAIPLAAPFEDWLGSAASVVGVFLAVWINSQFPNSTGSREGAVTVAVTSRMYFGTGIALLCGWSRRARDIPPGDTDRW